MRSGRNDLGGQQTGRPEHNEMSAAPKFSPAGNRWRGHAGSRPILFLGKADDAGEETGKCTMRYRRGRGPSIPGRIRRDNVGKIPLAAGSGHNLQRLLKRGKSEGEKRGRGLAHESVGAMKEGQCPLRRWQGLPGDSNAGAVAKGLRTLGGLNTSVVLGLSAGIQLRQD
jgi:hypothetical protein